MTSKRKAFQLVACVVLLFAAAGCGGIRASHSISPASFFLPGLLKAEPPVTPVDPVLPTAPPVNQVALAR